jgi:hypothetical protein
MPRGGILARRGAPVIRSCDAGLARQSADTFQLVVGTLTSPAKTLRFARALDRLLVTLRDQRVDSMPQELGVLLDSVGTILKNKPIIESKLKQLVATSSASTPRRWPLRLKTCTRSP